MRALKNGFGLGGLFGVLAAAFGFAADPKPANIEAGEPRVQIRQEILERTNIGSYSAEVLRFIEGNFRPTGERPMPKLSNHPAIGQTAEGSDKKGVRSIRLTLGHYVGNPAPLLMAIPLVARTTTTVQWAFDANDKLVEVFVDKDSELGN